MGFQDSKYTVKMICEILFLIKGPSNHYEHDRKSAVFCFTGDIAKTQKDLS